MHKLIFIFAVLVLKRCHGEISLEKCPDIAPNLGFNTNVKKAELHPAADFSRYTLVKPRIYNARTKRQISTNKEEDGKHIHHLSVSYDIDGKEYVLDLQLNKELIPKGYFKKYQKNGEQVVNRPNKEEVELCHYLGKIRGVVASWAALSTCSANHISGVVFDGQDMHYLEKASTEDSDFNNWHFLYKHSDLVDNNRTCGYSAGHKHRMTRRNEFNRLLRYERAAEPTSYVKGPYNANGQSRYVELVFVVDNANYKNSGENMDEIEHICKGIANIINGLYAPLNIFIALIGIVIWTERDEINISTDSNKTLDNFSSYLGEKLNKEHPNDNAQLLTNITFDKKILGEAFIGTICSSDRSGGVISDNSPVVGHVAITVAHEMGHNFGMEHDTKDCACREKHCIMFSNIFSTMVHWSSCSLKYLALAFKHGMDYCLRNKPDSLFNSPMCGNGFVEPGEQCDCGLAEHCKNTCCNATTCMLYSNATCATGECCDLRSCRLKTASTLCRSADYECDLPEYCTGKSEYCPRDVYKMDTETCDGGKAYCYEGSCKTHSDQCKLLWGETGRSSYEHCYMSNTKGSRYGNCGYNSLNQSFIKCKDEDIFCGMLHCQHLNGTLEFGTAPVAIISESTFKVDGSAVFCHNALLDLGLSQINPGLTPNGAKCGESKMCVHQKCMSIASLRATGHTCRNNCSGNGVCNSLGNCHCKEGFAPPACDYRGLGGSEDSGPSTDPDEGKGFATAMFIIFFGIIPALAICGLLINYVKQNLRLPWKKSSAPRTTSIIPREPTTSQQSAAPTRAADNHSPLQEEGSVVSPFGSEFFGNFKGFSIAPLKTCETILARAGPLLPVPPEVVQSPNINNSCINSVAQSTFVNTTIVQSRPTEPTSSAINQQYFSVPPALPSLNPGSHPRAVISPPILEHSTCAPKDLIFPLPPNVPLRPAPGPANVQNKPSKS